MEPEGDKGAGLFTVGSFRLVPRASAVLQKSDTLAFYYQIYNPTPDAASGKPSLESTYSFFLKEADGWKPFRKPVVKTGGQVELYAIDLKDLLRPDQILPAEFRMEAKVTDKVGGQSATRTIEFTVLDPSRVMPNSRSIGVRTRISAVSMWTSFWAFT